MSTISNEHSSSGSLTDDSRGSGRARKHIRQHIVHGKQHNVHGQQQQHHHHRHTHAAKSENAHVNVNQVLSRGSEDSETREDIGVFNNGTKESMSSVGPFKIKKVKNRVIAKQLVFVLSVIIPFTLSVVIVTLLFHKPIGGRLYRMVYDNPSDSAAIVTIIAVFLDYLNILVVSNLLGFMQIRLADNPIFVWMLDNIGLGLKSDGEEFDADDDSFVSADKEDAVEFKDLDKSKELREVVRNTRTRALLVGVVAFALLYLPHLIWTGTLTPNFVLHNATAPALAYTPDFTQDSRQNWANNSMSDHKACGSTYSGNGVFNGCAAASLSGALFSDLGLGTSVSKHSGFNIKNDNAGYLYYGRSYGVGSAVGLYNTNVSSGTAFEWSSSNGTQISYNETGYHTTVQCSTNTSSAWSLSMSPQSMNDSTTPSIFHASGLLPNSDWSRGYLGNQSHSVIGFSIDRAVAWAAQSSGGSGNSGNSTQAAAPQFTIAIAAGSNYSIFDKLQCSVSFTPRVFTIQADLQGTTIQVVPLNSTQQPVFDQGSLLAYTAMNQLGILSELQASPYDSQLGQSLLSNVKYPNPLSNEGDSNDDDDEDYDPDFSKFRDISADTVASSVADSIQVALDDILVFVSSGQYYFQGNSSQVTDAILQDQEIQIGTTAFGFAALAFNSFLLLALIVKLLVVFVGPRFGYDRSKRASIKHQSVREARISFHKEAQKKRVAEKRKPKRGGGTTSTPTNTMASAMQIGDDGTVPILTERAAS